MSHEQAIREIAAVADKYLMQFIAELEKEHAKLVGEPSKPRRVFIASTYAKTSLTAPERN